MSGRIPNHEPVAVDSLPVAPHRYLWDAPPTLDGDVPYKEWVLSVPYKRGEVIWFLHNGEHKRGLIVRLEIDRDLQGDKREAYMVRPETKSGYFSKRLIKTYPGFIQRGYHAAGLAPDYKG